MGNCYRLSDYRILSNAEKELTALVRSPPEKAKEIFEILLHGVLEGNEENVKQEISTFVEHCPDKDELFERFFSFLHFAKLKISKGMVIKAVDALLESGVQPRFDFRWLIKRLYLCETLVRHGYRFSADEMKRVEDLGLEREGQFERLLIVLVSLQTECTWWENGLADLLTSTKLNAFSMSKWAACYAMDGNRCRLLEESLPKVLIQVVRSYLSTFPTVRNL